MSKLKNKKLWKNIGIGVLTGALCIGAVAGIGALANKSDDPTKTLNPSWAIGGLTAQGQYLETKESIYTKNAFECQGLDIEIDFDNNISYQVFFYDFENDFLSSTGKLTANYNEETTPVLASYARIVVTPKDDQKISWYEKGGYADQLTITVNKEQKVVEKKDLTSLFTFTSGKAVIADSTSAGFGTLYDSTSFKASENVDISRYVGKTLEITLPIYTTNAGTECIYGLVFFDEDENPINTSVRIPLGLNSVDKIQVEIPEDAKYVRTTYYADDYDNYNYKGNFYALIFM